MAKCVCCGKSGLMLQVNEFGLCDKCVINQLQLKINELSKPELQNLDYIQKQINQATTYLNQINYDISIKQNAIIQLENEINYKRQQVINLDEEALMQSFGLYKPQYDLMNVGAYRIRLESIRYQQKEMIRFGTAVTGAVDWEVNGSASQGKKMIADMQKLLLRAFNGECDELVAKVKYNNLDAYIKRICSSCEAISKLGKIMSISISAPYMYLKIDELKIAFEYAQAKQREKEEQKAYREQLREEAKLQKEIKEAKQKLLKELTHYENELVKVRLQLLEKPDDIDLKEKIEKLRAQYNDTEKAIANVDYRAANHRAGYVYVISNIGSFGENIYKIGMTRRLEPMERIDELSDASVPFNFDVHAMIFTEDAPGLEAALHNAFEDRKLNLVNHRREFFNVTLDEIKEVIRNNFDKTVEFIDFPNAEQFRISQKIRKN